MIYNNMKSLRCQPQSLRQQPNTIVTGKRIQWTRNSFGFPSSFPELSSVQASIQTMTVCGLQRNSVSCFHGQRDFPSSSVKEREEG